MRDASSRSISSAIAATSDEHEGASKEENVRFRVMRTDLSEGLDADKRHDEGGVALGVAMDDDESVRDVDDEVDGGKVEEEAVEDESVVAGVEELAVVVDDAEDNVVVDVVGVKNAVVVDDETGKGDVEVAEVVVGAVVVVIVVVS